MHIKQVTIQGFRSYKDQGPVEPFSKKHNVVVGKNGSGKSNFFKAIQFVLGDESEFGRLGADLRQGLLHEGTGSRVHTAFVEIEFDNSDSRIPVDSEEVILRRTVSAKQDQYQLNGKSSTKQDVANLLETAGFSKSNPYYIVKQGKVNELSTSAPEKRLALLYEVAGTKVYDERRKESQEAMKETGEKSEQIHKAIGNIEERLKTLEEEKEDLKKYQHLDKKRRMLEHTVFSKDLEQAREKVIELEEKRENKDAALKGLRKEMRDYGDEIQKFEKALREAKSKVTQHEEEKQQVIQELEEHHHRQTQLELAIKDAEGDDEHAKNSKVQMERELKSVRNEIEKTQLELDQLTPTYDAAVAEEEEASREVSRLKQRRAALFDKQSRGDRFKSKDERDKFLNNELRRIAGTMGEKQNTTKAAQKKLEDDKKRIKDLEKTVATLEQTVITSSDQQRQDQKLFYEEQLLKDGVASTQKELWRKENSMRETLRMKTDELAKRESDLRSVMGKSVIRGVDSVLKVINDWTKDPSKKQYVEGYRGMLIENVKCEEQVYTAVDTVAQNKLFNHVVTTDAVATKILDEVNRRGLGGDVTFLPLNRLTGKEPNWPDFGTAEVIPLIDKIKFKEDVAPAVNHVFGKTLVCRLLEAASEVSKQFKLDCVTPDGDTVSRRGIMFGGYVNRRESRMLIQKHITEIKADIQTQEEALGQVEAEIQQVEDELQKLNNSMSAKETKLQRVRILNEKSKASHTARKEELRTLLNGIEPREKLVQTALADIASLEEQKASFEKERGTELTSVLSQEEQQEVTDIDRQMRDLNKKVKALFDARRKLEVKRSNLQSLLQDNLTRRRDEIQSNMQESSSEDVGLKLLSLRRECDKVIEAVDKLRQRQTELDQELDRWIEDRRVRADKVERIRTKEREMQERIISDSKDLDKIISRLVLVQKEKDDCLHKIRELVALPAGLDNTEYMQKSLKQLGHDLDRVNAELKKFGHVNQRALDQYITYSEQRAKLLARRDELDRGAKSIVELMQNLEQQKFEAIMLTFQQVTRNFEIVFKELVPQGRGNLTLLRGSEESSIEDTRPTMEELDRFTGVGVKVTFTGGVGEMKDMHQLSGGQKTLVALATIFSIQRCDPAPFYLFDEVDQALDPDHRKSVGRMIERLSQNAQFISTTFRSELLDHADKFYGVKYDPVTKISRIDVIKKKDAQDFIDDDDSQAEPRELEESSSTAYTASAANNSQYSGGTRGTTSSRASKAASMPDPDVDEMDVDGGGAAAEDEGDDIEMEA
ncbi:Structural maintenance of chromosomes protein 3 [Hypsibius exemplaris]|uniref:Structural maintenance of chromosomes protein n=1 Tax=Hypsibius exemplaris TaxID=2072580 RepID=A0A1W0X7U4_HYPEX|nr:Structural maintenance of chromosomes protein 3 [Hypsibius exemplaris]